MVGDFAFSYTTGSNNCHLLLLFLFWRKRVLPNRVTANVLIAAGALLIGFASTLTRLGYGQFLYLVELLSAILMFTGFMVAAKPQPAAREAAAPVLASES